MQQLIKKLTSVRKKYELSREEIIALDDFIVSIMPKTGNFLKLWTHNHVIEETTGSCDKQAFEELFFIPDEDEDWIGYMDISNKDWIDKKWIEIAEKDLPTTKMKFERHMLMKSGCCDHMYREAGRDIDRITFSRSQIISIFQNHKELFVEDGRFHLFFYKNGNGKTFTFFIGYHPSKEKWWYFIADLRIDLTAYQTQEDMRYGKGTILFLPQDPKRKHSYIR